MTDFRSGGGDFKGIDRKDHNQLPMILAHVICGRVAKQFGTVVPMGTYRKINDEYAFEEVIGRPYALAGRTMICSIDDWKERYARDSRYQFSFLKTAASTREIYRR